MAAWQEMREELDDYHNTFTSIQKDPPDEGMLARLEELLNRRLSARRDILEMLRDEAEPDQVDERRRALQLAYVKALVEEALRQAQGPSERSTPKGTESEGREADELKDLERVLIVCDGTIACGKTSFLDQIEKILPQGVRVKREPVDPDCENSWWNPLAKFYLAVTKIKNPKTQSECQAGRSE